NGIESPDAFRLDLRRLHIQGDVEPNRTLSARPRKIYGLLQMVADRFGLRYHGSVLGNRTHDGHDVQFLGTELPDAKTAFQVRSLHLSRKDETRGRFQPGA